MDAGFASPIRKPRGQDIYAACGQLKSNSEKIRKSQINKLVPIHDLWNINFFETIALDHIKYYISNN